MIKSANISLASARLEGAVVQSIKDWATAFPQELIDFDRQMREKRERLISPNGMTRHGHMMATYDIPVKLHNIMSFRFGNDWNQNKEIRRYFFDHFRVGHVGNPKRGKQWIRVS